MPTEVFPPEDPREWMNRARSDLTLAKNRLAGVYLADLCFHAQQAAEKAVKALMIERDIEFPYVHDLTHLLGLLSEAGFVVPEEILAAKELTRYATFTRYPGLGDRVSDRQYADGLRIADTVVRWAEAAFEDSRLALDRPNDPADPDLDWEDVKDELLDQDQE